MTDMRLHGDGHSNIRCTDSLLSFESYADLYENMFDVVMTNPPFGSNLQKDSYAYLGDYALLKNKSKIPLEALGLERAVQLLRQGGRIGIVLPDSIFVNKSYSYVRKWMEENQRNHKSAIINFFSFRGKYKNKHIICDQRRQQSTLQHFHRCNREYWI